jgi:hypothetical protein
MDLNAPPCFFDITGSSLGSSLFDLLPQGLLLRERLRGDGSLAGS